MALYQFLSFFGFGAIMVSFYSYIFKQVKQTARSVKAICLGLQAVLRAQMVDDYNRYSEKGYAPIYAKQNFENCWIQYEALGANGVMGDIHSKFMALPNKRSNQ